MQIEECRGGRAEHDLARAETGEIERAFFRYCYINCRMIERFASDSEIRTRNELRVRVSLKALDRAAVMVSR